MSLPGVWLDITNLQYSVLTGVSDGLYIGELRTGFYFKLEGSIDKAPHHYFSELVQVVLSGCGRPLH